MTSSKEKISQINASKSTTELLKSELYDLRKAFEAGYSGQLRSCKYEETRAFTIALNYAIFQANQLEIAEDDSQENTVSLETQLAILKEKFLSLMED